MRIARYYRTVRHLKATQIWGRVIRKLPKPGLSLKPMPSLRKTAGQWVRPAPFQQSLFGPQQFRLLNTDWEIASAADWDRPDLSELLRYNLHYFDDMSADYFEDRKLWHVSLIQQWIENNQVGKTVGWQPYPTSLRIGNWIKWAQSGNELSQLANESLAVQVRWLRRNLEYHILGNHLLVNAKALIFAGLYFEGNEADKWLSRGLAILEKQIPEQILPDGGHFERSPMYHSLVLLDFLDLINLTRTYGVERLPSKFRRQLHLWTELIEPMQHWLCTMTHPDGEIAFFNDAAIGVAPPPSELEAYAARLGLPGGGEVSEGITHLADSGYVRLERGEAIVIIDIAPLGPDYLPAHGHADTLSFELSLRGRRIFVNSGVSEYGSGPLREWQRSTAAHNTIEINGESSSELWAGFRVGSRAKPIDIKIENNGEDGLMVACSHNGYYKSAGSVWHRRMWLLRDDAVDIEDTVSGEYVTACTRFYCDPQLDLSYVDTGDRAGHIILKDAGYFSSDGSAMAIKPSQYYPAFGNALDSSCIELAMPSRQTKYSLRFN